MRIFEHLQISGKSYLLRIGYESVKDPGLYRELVEAALSDIQPESKRAVWTIDLVHREYPELIIPYLPLIIERLPEFREERNQGSFLHIFISLDLSEGVDNLGILFDFCIKVMRSGNVQQYMKFYAMKVLANICRTFPDLKNEAQLIMEEQYRYLPTAHLKRTVRVLFPAMNADDTE